MLSLSVSFCLAHMIPFQVWLSKTYDHSMTNWTWSLVFSITCQYVQTLYNNNFHMVPILAAGSIKRFTISFTTAINLPGSVLLYFWPWSRFHLSLTQTYFIVISGVRNFLNALLLQSWWWRWWCNLKAKSSYTSPSCNNQIEKIMQRKLPVEEKKASTWNDIDVDDKSSATWDPYDSSTAFTPVLNVSQ